MGIDSALLAHRLDTVVITWCDGHVWGGWSRTHSNRSLHFPNLHAKVVQVNPLIVSVRTLLDSGHVCLRRAGQVDTCVCDAQDRSPQRSHVRLSQTFVKVSMDGRYVLQFRHVSSSMKHDKAARSGAKPARSGAKPVRSGAKPVRSRCEAAARSRAKPREAAKRAGESARRGRVCSVRTLLDSADTHVYRFGDTCPHPCLREDRTLTISGLTCNHSP